jgi:hypothetical protein
MINSSELSGSNHQRHLVANQEKLGEKCPLILRTSISFILQGSFPCRKILRHGANSFTSPPKDVVLRILSILKFHNPRPGLNPRTLGSMASTITTIPPRATIIGGIQAYSYRLWSDDVDWTQLAQDRVQWQTVVNTVMNFHVS